MHMSKSQNPLQIRIGDTVEIYFRHNSSEHAFHAKVTDIFDRTSMGCDACIDFKRLDGQTNEPVCPDACSVSHVTKIVKRAPYLVVKKPPRNIFAEMLAVDCARIREHGHGWLGYDRLGGIYIGSPEKLAIIALASARDTLDRMFDEKKFQRLWLKAECIGQVTNPDPSTYPAEHYTSVRWKIFKRWVIRNRHYFLYTQREVEQSGRDYKRAEYEDFFDGRDDPHEIDELAA